MSTFDALLSRYWLAEVSRLDYYAEVSGMQWQIECAVEASNALEMTSL
jgi:hypothetical protein